MGPVHWCRLSVLLLNMLFRIGLQGDVDRDREAAARVYFEEHGRWPDEEVRPTGRRWRLREGIATPESEAAEARTRKREEATSADPPDAPPR